MPVVPVPGVARATLKGMIGAQPWATTYHFKFGSSTAPWVQSDSDLLASTCYSSFVTNWLPHMNILVTLTEVDTLDLTNATGVGSTYTHAATAGSLSSQIPPSSASQVCQNHISARYRGGHPRSFLPPPSTVQQLNESQWTAAWATQIGTAQLSFITTVLTAAYTAGSSSLTHVVPRYTYTYTNDPVHHKYLKERSGLLNVFVVQGYAGQQRIGSQRRRLFN